MSLVVNPHDHAAIGDPVRVNTNDGKLDHPASTVLVVGKTATLTLGADGLIVLDDKKPSRGGQKTPSPQISKAKAFPYKLLLRESSKRLVIPFVNVLWAEVSQSDLQVHYAAPISKEVVRAASLRYPIDTQQRERAMTWVEGLLDRAYGKSQRKKRIKVLVNPAGGKGKAGKWYASDIAPIFAAAACAIDVEETKYRGHAIALADQLDLDAYDVVACCSGDGLPHEVFNGLGRRKDARRALRKVAVVQLPCGSGNAMSWNLCGTASPSLAALRIVKGVRTSLDLISITQGEQRTLSFLSQSLGLMAETDLGTDHLRWMGGNRFVYGFFSKVLVKAVYPCDLAVKVQFADKADIRAHYERELLNYGVSQCQEGSDPPFQNGGPSVDDDDDDDDDGGLPPLRFGTAGDPLPADWELVPCDKLGSFCGGKMAHLMEDGHFFPAALPHDGCIDLACVNGDISLAAAVQVMTTAGASSKTSVFDLAQVSYRKVLGYRIIPKGRSQGYISIDGEPIPFGPFQAEVHQALGTVLSLREHVYEAPGVVAVGGGGH